MAGEFLAGVKIELDYSSVDAFVSSVKSAVDKLNALRDEGAKGGTSTAGDAALLEGATSRARARGANGRFVSSSPEERQAQKNQTDLVAAVKENTKAHAKTQQVLAAGGAGGGGGRARARRAATSEDEGGGSGRYDDLDDRLAAYGSFNVGASERLARATRSNPYAAINRRLSGYNTFGSADSLSLREYERQRTGAYRFASQTASGVNSDLGSVLGGSNGLANDAATLASRLETANASLQAFSDKLDRTLDVSSVARENVGRQNYNRQVEAEMANIRRANGQGLGFGAGGTLYQQFQGATHNNDRNVASGKLNTDYQTFGQTITSHAARAASYIGPGLLIGGGIEELRMSVEEAQQAQMALREVQAQFDALGQGSQFTGFSDSIKTIAQNTGLATSEVADLGLAMKGVFGDTQQATIALEGVAQGAVAMGLSVQQAQQDITAIVMSFDALQAKGGSAVSIVTNEMLHLGDVTGVSAKDIQEATADVAPTAQSVGLGLNQTASLVAEGAQRSGQAPEVVGQTLAKLLQGITQNFGQIYQAFQATPGLQGQIGNLTSKNANTSITTLLQGLGYLNKNGQSGEEYQLLQSLGINSSAYPSLAGLISGSGAAGKVAQTQAPVNRTTEEFNLQMNTIEGTLNRLRQDFVNFGVTLVNSGIGTAFEELANGLGDLVKLATPAAHLFGDINSALNGLPAELTLFAAGIYGLKKVANFSLVQSLSTRFGTNGGSGSGSGALLSEGEAEGGGGGMFGIGLANTAMSVASAGVLGVAIGTELNKQFDISGHLASLLGGGAQSNAPTMSGYVKSAEGLLKVSPDKYKNDQIPANVMLAVNQLAQLSSGADGKYGSKTFDKADAQLRAMEKNAGLSVGTSPQAAAKRSTDQQKALTDKLTENYRSTDFTAAMSSFQAGGESWNELVQASVATTAQMRAAFAKTPSSTTFENLQAQLSQQNQLLDQRITASQSEIQSLQKTGSAGIDQANVSTNVGLLGTEKSTQGWQTTITAINSAATQYTQDAAAQATSIDAQNKILAAGYTLTAAQSAAYNKYLSKIGQKQIATNSKGQITIGGQQITASQAFSGSQADIQATQALSQARLANDPIAAAQAAVTSFAQQAQSYLATGGSSSDANYKNIIAQMTQAQETVSQAIIQQADAQSSIIQATLTAQGNPIGAAFAQYQQALKDVATRQAQDKALGVNPSQDTTLQNMIATQVSDQTQYLQTQFSTIQTTTQEQIYLGQITANQAIAQLEAGMAQAQGNQQLVLQYQQAIRQIQNSAGSNASFDIPSNLLVNPTLYQAARVNAGAGAAYNDNRQVQVTINVQNSSQTAGAVQQLVNAVGGSATGGSTTGPLVGATTS